MDLIIVFNILNKKKFYYFEGLTNNKDENIYINASTNHNLRGDFVDLRFGNNNHDLTIIKKDGKKTFANLRDYELYQTLRDNL